MAGRAVALLALSVSSLRGCLGERVQIERADFAGDEGSAATGAASAAASPEFKQDVLVEKWLGHYLNVDGIAKKLEDKTTFYELYLQEKYHKAKKEEYALNRESHIDDVAVKYRLLIGKNQRTNLRNEMIDFYTKKQARAGQEITADDKKQWEKEFKEQQRNTLVHFLIGLPGAEPPGEAEKLLAGKAALVSVSDEGEDTKAPAPLPFVRVSLEDIKGHLLGVPAAYERASEGGLLSGDFEEDAKKVYARVWAQVIEKFESAVFESPELSYVDDVKPFLENEFKYKEVSVSYFEVGCGSEVCTFKDVNPVWTARQQMIAQAKEAMQESGPVFKFMISINDDSVKEVGVLADYEE